MSQPPLAGFRAFLGKEFAEIVRTWKIWVLPPIMALFAITGPPLARWSEELLRSLIDDDTAMPDLPDPTHLSSYQQWTSNLSQIVLFTILVMLAGAVAGERKQGTAVLMLTKPLSRRSFLLAKLVANLTLIVVTTVVTTALTWGITRLLFDSAPPGRLIAATGVWLALILFLVTVMLLASTLLKSTAGAIGLGFLVYLGLSLASLWGPLAHWTPAGLVSMPGAIAGGDSVAWVAPVASSLLGAVVVMALTVRVFDRRAL